MEKEGEGNNKKRGKNVGKCHGQPLCGKQVGGKGAEVRTLVLYSAVLWNPLST